MTIEFKPAKLEAVSLIIGMIGSTGSGKTFSAMRLATGLADGKRFAVIDTEAGRAKHYAGQFQFDHADLHSPFRPQTYQEAIVAADQAGYPVIVVDSCSHEWAGEGGILDWQEEELNRMAGDDWAKRERVKVASWIKPKMAHKKMVQRLLQVRAHLILCFRAEEKIELVKNPQTGKMEIVPKSTGTGLHGWVPICEKSMPYELTMSFLLTADNPGVPQPIKLEEQHRSLINVTSALDERAGKKLGHWAAGDPAAPEPASGAAPLANSDSDSLALSYTTCHDAETFERLEKERSSMWPSLSRKQKTEMKRASTLAHARLLTGSQIVTIEWLRDELNKATTRNRCAELQVIIDASFHGDDKQDLLSAYYQKAKELR